MNSKAPDRSTWHQKICFNLNSCHAMKAQKPRNHVCVHSEFDTHQSKEAAAGDWPHTEIPHLPFREPLMRTPRFCYYSSPARYPNAFAFWRSFPFFQFSSSRGDISERGAASAAPSAGRCQQTGLLPLPPVVFPHHSSTHQHQP